MFTAENAREFKPEDLAHKICGVLGKIGEDVIELQGVLHLETRDSSKRLIEQLKNSRG